VIRPDGVYESQTRFGMYRWHIMDPVRFEKDLRVTIQALGWRSGGRYLPLQDILAQGTLERPEQNRQRAASMVVGPSISSYARLSPLMSHS
jgi:Protein of unknown function (DUF2961)